MAFSFEINKPQDIKKTLLSTRRKIMNGGGTFSGNEESGRFSGRGVDGIYFVGDSSVKITITKKPPLYPEASVRNAIWEYFRET